MKTVRVNLHKLMGQKAQREMRRITLRTVADETRIVKHTVYAMADGTIKLLPVTAIVTLCDYFSCTPGELLTIEDALEPTPPTP